MKSSGKYLRPEIGNYKAHASTFVKHTCILRGINISSKNEH